MTQTHLHLTFIEDQMLAAIRKLSPEQQEELRALSASQSLAKFTCMLQERFPQHAQYITEARVANVMAYDQQQQASMPANQVAPVNRPARQPARAASQPKQQKRGRGFTYAFARSTWITAAWNWFLMLASKAAEPVLTISVIYSCARLLPAIHTPVQVDNLVFICQMIALDIGGLGLRKLANQAKKDGNDEGAKLAGRVSTALLTIMGINVALSVLSSVAPLDPTVEKVIEGILLIARSIMAVLYAYVIHNLNSEDQGQGEPHSDPPPQPDVEQMIDRKLDGLSDRLMNNLKAQQKDQQESRPPSQEVDLDNILKAIMPHLKATLRSEARAIKEEIQGQVKAMLVEGQGHTSRPVSEPDPLVKATSQGQSQVHAEPSNVTVFPGSRPVSEPSARLSGTQEERLQTAYKALSANGARVSGRALTREAHVNRDVANEWLKAQGQQQEESETRATTEELEAIAQGQ